MYLLLYKLWKYNSVSISDDLVYNIIKKVGLGLEINIIFYL